MKSELRIEVLETPRLILRPYTHADAERITELLQDPEIHRWTSSIPYPYTIEHAHDFLAKRAEADTTGESFTWGITRREDGTLFGAMGLHEVRPDLERAELGYWIGEDFRGAGYATEAARRVVSWCFEVGEFHRIQAQYLPGNEASAGVMRNIGMREEGLLRGYGAKNGEYMDVYLQAILRDDPTWISTEDQLEGLR
jgi:RimJ/RimL family protein N-acetyltransferase